MTTSERAAPILTRTLSDFAEQTGQSVDLSKLREAEERFDALMEDTRAWLGHPISQGEEK